MSHEATELRREIVALRKRRDSLRLRATFVEDKDPDLAELYDEWADAASDEIGRAQNDLWEIEGRIGRAERIADAAFGRNP